MRHRLTLVNGMVLTGTKVEPFHTAVTINNGIIESVGCMPGGCDQIFDISGCSILPGFVNAHAHPGFKSVGGTDLQEYEADWLEACLAAGVTTVRDMGGLNSSSIETILRLRDELNAAGKYPRIVSAGKFLAAPGGYGGVAPITVTSEVEAHQAVDQAALAGADFIKTSLEYGFSAETALSVLSPGLLAAICEKARARGLRVAAHLTQCGPLRILAEAGITDAGHVPYEPMDESLIRLLVQKGVVMTPTLTLYRMFQEKHGAPLLDGAVENVRRFSAAGGTVAVGDDYIEPAEPWYRPGLPYGELELLAQAGLSHTDIIKALTKNGAEACGLGAVTGTLEPGKAADIAVVRGNPLESLECLKEIEMVVCRGRIVFRSEGR